MAAEIIRAVDAEAGTALSLRGNFFRRFKGGGDNPVKAAQGCTRFRFPSLATESTMQVIEE